MKEHKRPGWDEYFMGIVREVAKRATCDRGRNSAIIVKNKRIIATGYVGAPVGLNHCDEVGHLIKEVYDEDGNVKKHCVRTTHAEQNAIAQAARFGVSIDRGTIYTKMEPCLDCTKLLINAGIKRVVAEKRYHDGELSRQFLKDAGVKLIVLNEEVEEYKEQ